METVSAPAVASRVLFALGSVGAILGSWSNGFESEMVCVSWQCRLQLGNESVIPLGQQLATRGWIAMPTDLGMMTKADGTANAKNYTI